MPACRLAADISSCVGLAVRIARQRPRSQCSEAACSALWRAESAAAWTEGARRFESSGYDTRAYGNGTGYHQTASWAHRLANDIRHPAALAEEVANADVLSGGFEFG